MPQPTLAQLQLSNARWIDINSQFTYNSLPDRLPDGQAINVSSIFNLLNCVPGERSRTFQPEYGSWWRQFIQEPISPATAQKMKVLMIESIRKWEPRITIDLSNTQIVADTSIPGYTVVLAYAIPGLSDSQQLQFAVPVA